MGTNSTDLNENKLSFSILKIGGMFMEIYYLISLFKKNYY